MELILEYKDKQYVVPQGNWGEFSWTEGNMSCDCNRSQYIQEHCDSNFPSLKCGDEIKLLTEIPQQY